MDAGNMLKPMLARGELRMIGATTLDEYRKHIEKDAALERRFQQVFVGQPSVEDTIAILRGLKERYEVHHGVRIQDAALVGGRGAVRPLPHRPLPARQGHRPRRRGGLASCASRSTRCPPRSTSSSGASASSRSSVWPWPRRPTRSSKERLDALDEELANLSEQIAAMKAHWQAEKDAIDRIRELKEQLESHSGCELEREADLEKAAEIRYGADPRARARRSTRPPSASTSCRRAQKMLKEEVDEEDIAEVVSKWTGVPVTRLMEGEMAEAACTSRRSCTTGSSARTTRSPPWPTPSGAAGPACPTRTGRSARSCSSAPPAWARPSWPGSLADFLFDDERAMVRIDMSEYMEKHSVCPPHRRAARATSATTRAASSPRRCAAAPTPWCCSTRSRRPTPTCSTCCSSCSTTAGSPTARAARSTSPTSC